MACDLGGKTCTSGDKTVENCGDLPQIITDTFMNAEGISYSDMYGNRQNYVIDKVHVRFLANGVQTNELVYDRPRVKFPGRSYYWKDARGFQTIPPTTYAEMCSEAKKPSVDEIVIEVVLRCPSTSVCGYPHIPSFKLYPQPTPTELKGNWSVVVIGNKTPVLRKSISLSGGTTPAPKVEKKQ